ncbi:dihydrodipicolinate synthase family protein [Natrinema gelatinilyticum]|uniref:dihydrodipicolinate synthase family protein n=1 Tax=Natrinema gelatinilyticum TaxID=2961571 RepID=UPI0020C1EED7|nr:dihydrodipicolinate synthase family protein [Natrinema gelatinilyticum]
MSHKRLKQHLRDVSFTTTAPFSEDGSDVLYEEAARNTEAVLDAGGRSFIPCGNTGEYYSLTDEERLRLVETTVDVVGDDGAVIAGIGGSTKEAIEQTQTYEEVGVDGVMVHDPDHTYVHSQGIVEYYERLADATEIGIVMYKRGPALSLPAVSELSTNDNVVGLKFAVNDVAAFSKMVREVPGDIVFSTGIAERFAPAFALEGAEGFTTGIGSFAPDVSLALQEALEAEDWERALEIRDLTRPYEDLREEPGANNEFEAANNVPAIKHGLELAGLYGGPVREPLVELSEEDKRRAETYYEQLAEAEFAAPTQT